MGFHDVEWAYSIDRPLAETAVLAALCHRTDDATHETLVGQQTVAAMIGSSPEKVLRALKALEQAGVITRTRRHGAGGYRTSDLIRVNVDTYLTNRLIGDSPTRQISYQENRRHLPDDSSAPTWQKVTAEEINQIDQPENQPELSSAPGNPDVNHSFERAWANWPKRVEKKKSLQAFSKAAKIRGLDELTADIIRFGNAYAATTDRQFVPALCVWLNGERWTDELPPPRPHADRRQTPTERAMQTAAAGRRVADAQWDAFIAGPSRISAPRPPTLRQLEAANCIDHPGYPRINGICDRCEQEKAGAA